MAIVSPNGLARRTGESNEEKNATQVMEFLFMDGFCGTQGSLRADC
jgi:hypothetical protein